jgi:hypothetical protein
MGILSFIGKLKCNCLCMPHTEEDYNVNTLETKSPPRKSRSIGIKPPTRRPGSLDIQENIDTLDTNISDYKKNYFTSKRIIEMGASHKLQILPVMRGKEIVDLYPPTDQVHLWNTFVVGRKLNYIVANVNDLNIGVDEPKYLLNNHADNIMDKDIKQFFDHIWKETLDGVDLQFFMIKGGKTFFVNTYCLQNGNNQTIGGLCFIRNIETLPYFQLDDSETVVTAQAQAQTQAQTQAQAQAQTQTQAQSQAHLENEQ